ncbi:MAG: ribosome biogenesis GTPase Der [Planctomycetota bacterium]|nr:MAG: ribosome biogenesis GTPase Der [Planctomycetota bacterium]
MPLPTVVIVGRPNVGKSTLFNFLARRRIAIVEPTAGVTRDRISTVIEEEDLRFELVDTGGLGVVDSESLEDHIEAQIETALRSADLICFLVDARDGITPLDRRVANRLRRLLKPVVFCANKADTPRLAEAAVEFFELGLGEAMPVSAKGRKGRLELLQALSEHLGNIEGRDEPLEAVMRLAVVGKRNVGKSTLINTLAGEDRVIVSEVPGTTRDSVDVRFERAGQVFIAIDTAGLRKRARMKDAIERYSRVRTEAAIRRADVCLLLIDAAADISATDKKIARFVLGEKKPLVLGVNKWDLAKHAGTEAYEEYIAHHLSGFDFVPLAFMSAMTGEGVRGTIGLAEELYKQAGTRAPTAKVNQVLQDALRKRSPRSRGTALPKIYFASQVDVHPPTIVMFVNKPEFFSPDYIRYVENALRKSLPFAEVPLKLIMRERTSFFEQGKK